MASLPVLFKYKGILLEVWHERNLFSFLLNKFLWRPCHLIFIWVFQRQWKLHTLCCRVAKFWATRLNAGANGSNRGVLISSVSQAQPTQTVIFLPHFPHPSNLSQPFLPQLDDEKQWIYIQRAAILFSLLHRVLCFPLSPLLPCHWRLVNGLKRHSIGRCTPSRRGGLTFPGVGKRNSYRPQTSCPLNEHLIQFPDACNTKKQEWGVDMCWVGCRVGLGERGLWAGKSWWILDWFLNFSSLGRGGGRDETKRKNKHQIREHRTAWKKVAESDLLIYWLFIHLSVCLLCRVVKWFYGISLDISDCTSFSFFFFLTESKSSTPDRLLMTDHQERRLLWRLHSPGTYSRQTHKQEYKQHKCTPRNPQPHAHLYSWDACEHTNTQPIAVTEGVLACVVLHSTLGCV